MDQVYQEKVKCKIEKGSKVGIVSCSNGQKISSQRTIEKLCVSLKQLGLVPILSKYIYEKNAVFSGTGEERAKELMNFYHDYEIQAIHDISGGDIANEILPYLDYYVISKSNKVFWGYSDLTTVINAIYAKTGKSSVLYQVRNLVYGDARTQAEDFSGTVLEGRADIFEFPYQFIQGQAIEGVVVGGNIRCLLKLAGTEYWPDMRETILFIESFGGVVAQMTTYLCQLKQLGVFQQVKGILLGTFTTMEEEKAKPSMIELVQNIAGHQIPIIKTECVGHGSDSKAVLVGGYYQFRV